MQNCQKWWFLLFVFAKCKNLSKVTRNCLFETGFHRKQLSCYEQTGLLRQEENNECTVYVKRLNGTKGSWIDWCVLHGDWKGLVDFTTKITNWFRHDSYLLLITVAMLQFGLTADFCIKWFWSQFCSKEICCDVSKPSSSIVWLSRRNVERSLASHDSDMVVFALRLSVVCVLKLREVYAAALLRNVFDTDEYQQSLKLLRFVIDQTHWCI